jgi:TonB family protein
LRKNVIKNAVVNRQYWFAYCLDDQGAHKIEVKFKPDTPNFPFESLRLGLFGSATVLGGFDDSGNPVFSDFSKPKFPADLRKVSLENFALLKLNSLPIKNVLRVSSVPYTFGIEPDYSRFRTAKDNALKQAREQVITHLGQQLLRFDKPLEADFLERPQVDLRAHERELQGKVEFEFTVGESGTVTEFRALSSPDALLVQLTLDAVRRWRFKPLTKNGNPAGAKLRFAFNFVKTL